MLRFRGMFVLTGDVGVALLLLLSIYLSFGKLIDGQSVGFEGVGAAWILFTVIGNLLLETHTDLQRSSVELALAVFLADALAAGATLVFASLFSSSISNLPLAGVILVLITKFVLGSFTRILISHKLKQRHFSSQVLVIGKSAERARAFVDKHLPQYLRHADVFGIDRVLSEPEEIQKYQLVFGTPDLNLDERSSLVRLSVSYSLDLQLIPTVYDLLMRSGDDTYIGQIPALRVERLGLHPFYAFIKRVIDLVSSLVILLCTSLLWLATALIIRMTSPGPILFTQERVGQHGKPFTVCKFRTMVHNAEKKTGPVWATKDDPRVTKVGKWLRSTRLDELPQLWNVFKGEMSLVGPRPERPVFVEQFTKEYPEFVLREMAKPGITGFAQVFGRYDTEPMDKLRYDLLYITKYSPLLDLQIMLWTVQVILFPQTWVDRQADRAARIEYNLISAKVRDRQAL